jgi:iron complex transport system ATP-binding protein
MTATVHTPPARDTHAAMLELQNIHFSYGSAGRWSLAIKHLSVATGEVVAIIGPNGSGKSTLLNIAAGIRRPDSGKAMVGNSDIFTLSRRAVARQLGYLPQHVSPYFDLTVEQVVRLGRYPYLRGIGNFSDNDLRAVRDAMRWTETTQLAARPLSRLSGGERQRVLLASVLAQETALLLLDEPTNALDAHHQVSFFGLLRRLAAAGTGIAVVTHDINLATLFADRIYLLADGQVFAEGAAESVVTSAILETAYGPELHVITHPQTNKPVVLPAVPRTNSDSLTAEQAVTT